MSRFGQNSGGMGGKSSIGYAMQDSLQREEPFALQRAAFAVRPPFVQVRNTRCRAPRMAQAGHRGPSSNVHKAGRRSSSRRVRSKLGAARPLDPIGKDVHSLHTPTTHQRPAARLHELTGSRLPGHLARDDPPVDRCRAHQLLQDARWTAALLAPTARGIHELDAPRRRDPRGGRRRTPRRTRRLISWQGARTSRAASCRRRCREAGRSSRPRRRSARSGSPRGESRRPPDRRPRRRAPCASGCGS
jgi:hypothetical protein